MQANQLLQRPTQGRDYQARAGLDDKVKDAICDLDCPVVLLAAPSGYGKTTFLEQFVHTWSTAEPPAHVALSQCRDLTAVQIQDLLRDALVQRWDLGTLADQPLAAVLAQVSRLSGQPGPVRARRTQAQFGWHEVVVLDAINELPCGHQLLVDLLKLSQSADASRVLWLCSGWPGTAAGATATRHGRVIAWGAGDQDNQHELLKFVHSRIRKLLDPGEEVGELAERLTKLACGSWAVAVYFLTKERLKELRNSTAPPGQDPTLAAYAKRAVGDALDRVAHNHGPDHQPIGRIILGLLLSTRDQALQADDLKGAADLLAGYLGEGVDRVRTQLEAVLDGGQLNALFDARPSPANALQVAAKDVREAFLAAVTADLDEECTKRLPELLRTVWQRSWDRLVTNAAAQHSEGVAYLLEHESGRRIRRGIDEAAEDQLTAAVARFFYGFYWWDERVLGPDFHECTKALEQLESLQAAGNPLAGPVVENLRLFREDHWPRQSLWWCRRGAAIDSRWETAEATLQELVSWLDLQVDISHGAPMPDVDPRTRELETLVLLFLAETHQALAIQRSDVAALQNAISEYQTALEWLQLDPEGGLPLDWCGGYAGVDLGDCYLDLARLAEPAARPAALRQAALAACAVYKQLQKTEGSRRIYLQCPANRSELWRLISDILWERRQHADALHAMWLAQYWVLVAAREDDTPADSYSEAVHGEINAALLERLGEVVMATPLPPNRSFWGSTAKLPPDMVVLTPPTPAEVAGLAKYAAAPDRCVGEAGQWESKLYPPVPSAGTNCVDLCKAMEKASYRAIATLEKELIDHVECLVGSSD